jgi:hypothetical protein
MKSKEAMKILKRFIEDLYNAKGDDEESKIIIDFCKNNGIDEKLLSETIQVINTMQGIDSPKDQETLPKTYLAVVAAVATSVFNNLGMTAGNLNYKDVDAAMKLFNDIVKKDSGDRWSWTKEQIENLEESSTIPMLSELIDSIQKHHNSKEHNSIIENNIKEQNDQIRNIPAPKL